MRPSVYVVLWAPAVAGLPVPAFEGFRAYNFSRIKAIGGRAVSAVMEVPNVLATLTGSRKHRQKRQLDWSWYSGYHNNQAAEEAHWTDPSRNPFDICEIPEGKQLGAQCSGGSISVDHTDSWDTDHTDVHFTSWTMGPPDKRGWKLFAPVSSIADRTGASGASRASTPANSGTLPLTNGGGQIDRGGSPR